MSRRTQRKIQNAASLLTRPAAPKLCNECGKEGRACYDMQGDLLGIFCREHARARGCCPSCGESLTEAEKARERGALTGYCFRCWHDYEADGEEREFDGDDDDDFFD